MSHFKRVAEVLRQQKKNKLSKAPAPAPEVVTEEILEEIAPVPAPPEPENDMIVDDDPVQETEEVIIKE